MSRVGKNPVAIPAGVEVKVNGSEVVAKGKLGQLSVKLTEGVTAKVENGHVVVAKTDDTRQVIMNWATCRNLIKNIVLGVSSGYSKTLEIEGVGFRAAVQGKELVLQLGFSHEVHYPIPQGITIKAEKPTQVTITGADKQLVGQVAAELRGLKKPEPYKGKGIKYEGEVVRRKVGKAGAKGKK